MLRQGASQPWQNAMKILTGQSIMDASGILEYFSPLHNWLEEYNKKNDVFLGWEESDKGEVLTNSIYVSRVCIVALYSMFVPGCSP